MKKRIFAALVAALMVLSVFVFASCDPDEASSSSPVSTDESKPEEPKKELTPKELFTASLTNLSASAEDSSLIDFSSLTNAKDEIASLELTINKLSSEGEDLTANGALSLKGDIKLDADNNATSVDIAMNLFGETPTLGITTIGNQTYFTDVLGVNEKPIAMIPTEDISDIPEFDATFFVDFIKKSSEIIKANINDEAFAQEIKDVTVDGKDFKGAKVITLTITDATAKKIAGEMIDELLKNEAFKSIYGEELNKDEVLSEMELPTAVRIVNTVVEEKSIALDIELELPETTDDEIIDDEIIDDEIIDDEIIIDDLSDYIIYEDDELYYEDDEYYEDDYVYEDLPAFNKIVAHVTYVDDNFKFDMGPVDADGKYFEEHGYISCAYTLENGNESFVFSVTEFGETSEFIKLSGTYKDEKHEGTMTLDIEGQVITVKYSLSADENKGSLKLTDLSFVVDGATVTFPFEFVTNYTASETKLSMEGSIKFSVEDTFEIDAEFAITAEYKDVTIGAIADSIPMEEFDITAYEDEIIEKFPLINSLLDSFGSEDEYYDEYYDEEYYY